MIAKRVGLGLLGVVGGVVLGGALLYTGDTAGGGARNLIVACDASGPSPEDVCTRELIVALGHGWLDRSLDSPGARFQVLAAGRNFSDTTSSTTQLVPSSWPAEAQAAMATWSKRVGRELDAVHIRRDVDQRINSSDLVSLLAMSARVAQEISGGGVELVLATDGRMISLGFNAEREVPTAGAVETRMHHAGVHIDLSAFGAVTVCGLHNVDTNAADAEALAQLWRALVTDLGGPKPTILTSCRSLIASTDPGAAGDSPGEVEP